MDVIERATRFNEDAYVIAAGDPALVHDLVAEVKRLREGLYIAMTTSHNLGGHIADIAEAMGMDRDSRKCGELKCPCGCGGVVKTWHVTDCPDDCAY
jgi:hypothetical protein